MVSYAAAVRYSTPSGSQVKLAIWQEHKPGVHCAVQFTLQSPKTQHHYCSSRDINLALCKCCSVKEHLYAALNNEVTTLHSLEQTDVPSTVPRDPASANQNSEGTFQA